MQASLHVFVSFLAIASVVVNIEALKAERTPSQRQNRVVPESVVLRKKVRGLNENGQCLLKAANVQTFAEEEQISIRKEKKDLKDNVKTPPKLTSEVLSGLVVALSCIPSSISFAGIAGVNPLIGIWSCVILGLVSSSIRGRPGLISGAAGVVVVPLAPLVAKYGTQYMGAAIILSAVIQFAFGIAKVGRFISIITDPVMSGFLNGLGCLLAVSQFKLFAPLQGTALVAASSLAALTAAIIEILPRFTTAVPSSLIGVIVATVISTFFKLPVETLSDVAGASTFAGGLAVLPSWTGVPKIPLSMDSLKIIAPVSLSIAAISMLESLLAAKVVAQSKPICDIPPTKNDRVLFGNALGNAASALMGGFGGCGLIPQTFLNMQSGGRGIVSSISYAVSMAACIVAFAPVIGAIPLCSLAGLMLSVACGTIQWKATYQALKNTLFNSYPLGGKFSAVVDLISLLIASVICYRWDMATGIVLGVVATKLGTLMKTKLGSRM